MKPRYYALISNAVENGIAQGYRRSHKHTEAPDEDHMCSEIYTAIMNELSESFEFGDGGDGYE